ncbi:MAG: hypothetical protein MHM6MM_003151 [Cercozoa sp. M6MM]
MPGAPVYLYAAQWQRNADERTERIVKAIQARAKAAQDVIAQRGSLPLTVVSRVELMWSDMLAKWQAQRLEAERQKRRQRMQNRRARQQARRQNKKRQTRRLDAADVAAGIVDTSVLSASERDEIDEERRRQEDKQRELKSQLSSLAQTMSALQGLPIRPVGPTLLNGEATAAVPAAAPAVPATAAPAAAPVPPLPQEEPAEEPKMDLMAAIRSGSGRRRLRSVDRTNDKKDATVDEGEAGATMTSDEEASAAIVIKGRQRRLSTVAAQGGSLLEQIHSVKR